jgi:hypothetical protein
MMPHVLAMGSFVPKAEVANNSLYGTTGSRSIQKIKI